jgi:transitional endoplasmic reticulum ATPase
VAGEGATDPFAPATIAAEEDDLYSWTETGASS